MPDPSDAREGALPATALEGPFPADTLEGAAPATLVELVNRVVDRGVSLTGDLTISVADVDLLYLGLRLVLKSVDEESADRGSRRILGETRAEAGGDRA
jgi:hypothetical protein